MAQTTDTARTKAVPASAEIGSGASPSAPTPAPASPPAPIDEGFPPGMTERKAWITLFVLVLGQMASALNQTTMTSSLAVIMGEFGITANLGQWLTTAYMLFLGVTMPLSAHLMTKYRTRPLFSVALGIFVLGALLGVVQHNFVVLVVARCIQACGSGIVVPLVQVVAFRIFPYHKRGEATGVAAMAVAVAPAVGPVLAGVLTDTLGWRSIFTVTGGMALLSMVLAWRLLRSMPEHPHDHRLDMPSFVLSSLMAAGIVCGCSDMGTFGLLAWQTIAPLAVGVAAGVLFVYRQLHIDEPLLDMRAFRCGPFALACLLVMVIQGSVVAINNFVCLFVQNVQGYSAALGGLTMLPGAVVMMVLSPLAGRTLDHHGPRGIAIVGFAMLVTATGLLATLTPASPLWMSVAFQTLRFAGVACLNQMLVTWGINQLGNGRFTQGTATANAVRQMGAAATNALFFSLMDLSIPALGEGAAITHTFALIDATQLVIAVVVLGLMFTKLRKAASSHGYVAKARRNMLARAAEAAIHAVRPTQR